MGFFIILSTTACTTMTKPVKAVNLALNNSDDKGGNPEVLNHCFALSKTAKSLCFDRFFPGNINLLIHPSHGIPIMLAGRGESIEKRELKLNNDDLVLLYLEITNVKTPLSTNVKSTQFSYDKNTVVINIDVKKIEETIIIKDKNGKIVLEYTVKR
jgi:hypothetical protein